MTSNSEKPRYTLLVPLVYGVVLYFGILQVLAGVVAYSIGDLCAAHSTESFMSLALLAGLFEYSVIRSARLRSAAARRQESLPFVLFFSLVFSYVTAVPIWKDEIRVLAYSVMGGAMFLVLGLCSVGISITIAALSPDRVPEPHKNDDVLDGLGFGAISFAAGFLFTTVIQLSDLGGGFYELWS